MTGRCPAEFLAFAHRLADASGEVLRRYFRTPIAVSDKEDLSPVTAADREAESVIRGLIEKAFPDHGVIGEEFEPVRAQADYVWIVDPLDGTKSFITGKPLFGTLIALLHRGAPLLGLMDHPAMGERWIAGAGVPTRCNGAPVRVRRCPDISKAVLYTTSPDAFEGRDREAFARLRDAVRLAMYGGDCYAYGLLASGFVDIVVEPDLGPDDFFPLAPVVEHAGGLMTDWSGARLTMKSDGRVIAAGDPALHARALALLAG